MTRVRRFNEYVSEGYRAKLRMKGSEIKALHAEAAEAVSGLEGSKGRKGPMLEKLGYVVIWDGETVCEFCPKDLLITFKADFSGNGWTLSDRIKVNFGNTFSVRSVSDTDDYLVDKILR